MSSRNGSTLGVQRLSFRIGDRKLDLPIARVRRVASPEAFARLPRQPGWLRGLANVDGEVVAVLDLAAWLGRPAAPAAPRLLVVEASGERMALLVDEVLGIAEPATSLRSPAADGGGESRPAASSSPLDLEALVAAISAELPAWRPRQVE